MEAFVTGCAGFVGSNLVDRLLKSNNKVIGYDNFSTGRIEFLEEAIKNPNFTLINGDILDNETLLDSMSSSDFVFHLAANADVRFGLEHPTKDFLQNTQATLNILESMRKNKITEIAFSSTGSIYGETKTIPTPENDIMPIQTSLYGASKISAENFIHAYCEGFGFKAYIFRFVSILGPRYTHGHVYDFYKQLKNNPNILNILGDGTQTKSYLNVEDCINGILIGIEKGTSNINTFNLGTNDYIQVRDSAKIISDSVKLEPKFNYSGGNKGWVGDNPFIYLDTSKIRALGWIPKHDIKSSIKSTCEYFAENNWVLEI